MGIALLLVDFPVKATPEGWVDFVIQQGDQLMVRHIARGAEYERDPCFFGVLFFAHDQAAFLLEGGAIGSGCFGHPLGR